MGFQKLYAFLVILLANAVFSSRQQPITEGGQKKTEENPVYLELRKKTAEMVESNKWLREQLKAIKTDCKNLEHEGVKLDGGSFRPIKCRVRKDFESLKLYADDVLTNFNSAEGNFSKLELSNHRNFDEFKKFKKQGREIGQTINKMKQLEERYSTSLRSDKQRRALKAENKE